MEDSEIVIEIYKLSNESFHASILGDCRNTTQEGNTKEEAIGKLITAYPLVFGIKIVQK